MIVELKGTIQSVTYASEETSFAIVRLLPEGASEPVTVVGTIASPAAGEELRVWGSWKEHPKYGRQLEVEHYEMSLPATEAGVESYLGSGLVKGIGPRTAHRIVERFGEETLRVIEEEPDRLREVPRLGAKKIEAICAAWAAQKGVRDVMIALRSMGVSPAFAARIWRRYGEHAAAAVRDDPYRLAAEVDGIGFLTADRIARAMGRPVDSASRLEAGLVHSLAQLVQEGHVYAPSAELVLSGQKLLDVERAALEAAIGRLAAQGRLIVEEGAVYLPALHAAERGVTASLARLARGRRSVAGTDTEAAVRWAESRLGLELAPRQVEAVRLALERKLLVITGGPGTGKTTILRALVEIAGRMGVRVLLAAPTGRAAKRMEELAGREARTIHRLLEFDARGRRDGRGEPVTSEGAVGWGGFRRNAARPLECDLLVVDEASMVDTPLMHHLLAAVPEAASLVLVGDAHQLPSVGPGNVLRDVIASGRLPVVELDQIFRQAGESHIVRNAHRIRLGLLPERTEGSSEERDFYFIEQDDPERIVRIITQLVTERIPRRLGGSGVDDVQVLTPMHRGPLGAEALNRILRDSLNPRGEELKRGERTLRVGDRVMQVRNDYDREVFNGDVGRIVGLDRTGEVLSVLFDGRRVGYGFNELDELAGAFALTVHKSQGSEYPAVVMPVVTQHYVLLQRNLLYTAVTRGKRLVVLVGSWKALAVAVRNDRAPRRFTKLEERLRLGMPEA